MSYAQAVEREVTFGYPAFNYAGFHRFLAEEFPEFRAFAEIGCWKGFSTVSLAKRVRRLGGVLYAVDPWAYRPGVRTEHWGPMLKRFRRFGAAPETILYDVYTRHLEQSGCRQVVKDLRFESLQAAKMFADGELDFVFIDASHEYRDVCDDILAWRPKVRAGGVLAGHDYAPHHRDNVVRAVDELVPGRNLAGGDVWWVEIGSGGD